MKKVNVRKQLNDLLGSLMLLSLVADEAVEQTHKILKSLPLEEGEETGKEDPKEKEGAEEMDKLFDDLDKAVKNIVNSKLFGGKGCRQ